MKGWRRIILRWLPLMVWMGVVLGIGGSGALPMQEGSWQRWLLRKGIHIGEYAVLGLLFYRVLAINRQEVYPSHALGAACMTVAFAGLDEWRQTFIPGRSGRLLDVGIDAVGAGLGQVMVWSSAKRLFDLMVSSVGLVASAPLWGIIALAIKSEDGGPVFFRDLRVGQGGELFTAMKFRTMVRDADSLFGPRQATEDDPRVTRVGRLLRATAMDELPQLWNIFRGEMSFVGPRALRPGEIESRGARFKVQRSRCNVQGSRFKVQGARFDVQDTIAEVVTALEEIPGYSKRHVVRPGLTGIAQIFADRDIPSRQKFRYDLLYIRRRSFWLDVRLIALSFWVTFRGRWEVRGTKF
jgi:lipopolysaccharide/colanic/teichoic acid biosynthesis glycosyltransferase